MTVIKFHGLLAKKFGDELKLHLGSLNYLNSAIDAVKPGFINFLKKSEQNSQFYSVSKNLNENVINIYPCIIGSGPAIPVIFAVLLVIGITVAAVGIATKNATLLKIAGYIFAIASLIAPNPATFFLATILQAVASGYGNYLEAMQALQRMKFPKQTLSSGGDASLVATNGKSYLFARTINMATQGTGVPIVYGKLRLGSKLILVSIKSCDSNKEFEEESWTYSNLEAYG
jgi:predicted phage tail protein